MINKAVNKAMREAMKPVKSQLKGAMGEALTSAVINLSALCGIKGRQLNNLYIPMSNGNTTEIDLVFLTEKGVYVIENKSYSGIINGEIAQREWLVTAPSGKTYGLYNPIMQNQGHIKAIKSYLENNSPIFAEKEIKFFSVVVFSDSCILKIGNEKLTDSGVVFRSQLVFTLKELWNLSESALNDTEINEIFDLLKSFQKPDKAKAEEHNQYVEKNRVASSAQQTGQLCPKCGKPLLIRTVKKGSRAGQKFIGCSGFPNCRFTKDI